MSTGAITNYAILHACKNYTGVHTQTQTDIHKHTYTRKQNTNAIHAHTNTLMRGDTHAHAHTFYPNIINFT
jgi:hypothetical protein